MGLFLPYKLVKKQTAGDNGKKMIWRVLKEGLGARGKARFPWPPSSPGDLEICITNGQIRYRRSSTVTRKVVRSGN